VCTAAGCDRPADLDHLVGRRGFLKASAALALGTGVALARPAAAAPARVPTSSIALQLYTCRDQLTADPEGTLRALAQLGYRKVEHAGYAGLSAADFRKVADRAGVRVPTGHTSVPFPYDDAAWRTICEDAVTVGQKYVIEPLPSFALAAIVTQAAGAPREVGVPAALWVEYAHTLDRAALVAKEYGLKVGYHNHDPEFTLAVGDLQGRTGYEILLDETTPGLVDFTLDLYWSWHGGADPVELLRRYPDRIKRFHVKDMDESGGITDPGKGVIDFRRIFKASQRLGMQLYTVEQDNAGERALDVAKHSYRFLTGLRY
jgi:sugar phosphate isomerase/epimerase